MKRLMIGLVLAVFLIECEAGEKSKFSINENDTSETYANNPVFVKVISADPEVTLYKFTDVPTDVHGIKTSDLDVLGGYITILTKKNKLGFVVMRMKGKASFNKLLDRVNKADCEEKTSFEKDTNFSCRINRMDIEIYYEPLSNISNFGVSN